MKTWALVYCCVVQTRARWGSEEAPSPQRHAPSSFFGSEKWCSLPNERKIHFDCCFFLFLGISALSSLLDCCVLFPPRARWGTEAPSPQHPPSSFFGSGEMAPTPQLKKNPFWLLFLSSCLSLAAVRLQKRRRAASHCVIVWRRWCFRSLRLSAHEQRRLFLLRFIFAVNQPLACTSEFICPPERAGWVHTGGACALGTRRPNHLFRAESFGGGSCWGSIVWCWRNETSSRIIPLKNIAV